MQNKIMAKTKKKAGKIIGLSLGAVVLAIIIVAATMFGNIGLTMLNLKVENENGLYSVKYTEDYKLDELLERGGVSNEDELVQYILEIMLKGLPINIPYEVPELGCSTFAAKNSDGGYLFARNYDNRPTDCCVVKTNPKDGYSSVSVVSLSFLGYNEESTPDALTNRIRILATPYFPLDGVNEKGLAVGVLQLFAEPTNQESDKVDVDTTLAIRVLLDKCATVEEAISMLEGLDMHASAGGCYHLHVADASGNSAVISYVDNEMVVTRPEEDYQVATNFYVHDVDFEYTKHGEDRFEIITKGLKKADGALTAAQAMNLLESAAQTDTVCDDGTLCTTQWSSIYDLTNPSLTLCNDLDYDNTYTYSVD